jgi:hypothetical protein
MSDDARQTLAIYLSGPLVAKHSMGLSLGGLNKTEADAFFCLRQAFGVSGYKSADEARAAIDRTLDQSS